MKGGRGEERVDELERRLESATLRTAMAERVVPKLFEGCRFVDMDITHRRRRTYASADRHTKSSVLATCTLTIADSSTAVRREPIYLQAFLDGRSSRFTDVPGSRVVEADHDIVVWALPGDPRLPGLASVLEAPDTVNAQILRYKPLDRCTLRVAGPGRVHDRRVGGTERVAKVFASRERGLAARDRLETIWEAARVSGSGFRSPRPIGFDHDTGVLWLTFLDGCSPRREQLDPRLVASIACALGSFHRSAVGPLVTRSHADQLDQFDRNRAALASAAPREHALLDQISSLAHRHCPAAPLDTVTSHGAFRLRQVLLSDRPVAVVDFDSVAAADRCEDVSDMMLDVEPDPMSWARDGLARSFLRHYECDAEAAVDHETLTWYVALALFKRAYWLRTRSNEPAASHALAFRLDRAFRVLTRLDGRRR